METTQRLGHLGVGVTTRVIYHVVVASLSDTELKGLLAETQVLCGNISIQEDVDTFADRGGKRHNTVDGRLSVKHTDEVGKVVQDRQIVLDDNDIVVGTKQTADLTCGGKTLLDIEERGRLVEHVHIGLLNAYEGDGETLQLSTRKQADVSIENVSQFQLINHLIEVVHLSTSFDEFANRPICGLDGFGDLVDILRLDNSLEIVFEDLGEVV